MSLKELQDDVKAWHGEKYPHATLERIGIKLAEETGEICRAIDRIIHAKSPDEEHQWMVNLTEEIGDTSLVLMVLCIKGHLDFEETLTDRAAEVMLR